MNAPLEYASLAACRECPPSSSGGLHHFCLCSWDSLSYVSRRIVSIRRSAPSLLIAIFSCDQCVSLRAFHTPPFGFVSRLNARVMLILACIRCVQLPLGVPLFVTFPRSRVPLVASLDLVGGQHRLHYRVTYTMLKLVCTFFNPFDSNQPHPLFLFLRVA